MTNKEIKEMMQATVLETLTTCKKMGLLKDLDGIAYKDATEMLAAYFNQGEKEMKITYALQVFRFDPYFRIIPLYFGDGRTLEDIAEEMGVDVSTIVRNKKRLCLAIYNEII